MLVPYSWIKEFIDIKKSAEAVANDLSLFTIGVESVEERGREKILNLNVTYNRGDLLSIFGIARELSALYNRKLDVRENKFSPPKGVEVLRIKSDLELAKIYTLTRISNLAYKSTPKAIKNRLELAGMRSINLWADLTNYLMLEWGQPFHVFDAEKVARRNSNLLIEVRHAKRGETIRTLDGFDHNLSVNDVVIADRKGPIAIAGVMGGENTEVDEGTTEILLEAAIFDPIYIRKTARRLGLRSEASNRFEHHLSPENLLIALSKITQMYELNGGGKITGFSSVGYSKTEVEPIVLTQEKLNNVSGEPVSIGNAREYLKKLGFKVMSSQEGLLCWAPHWRGDISIPEDLAEEVIRLHGYEGLPPRPLQTEIHEPTYNRLEVWRDLTTHLLADLDFNEVKTYPFVSTKSLIHLDGGNLHKLINPISVEAEYLRPFLILSLMEVAQQNSPRFENGKIFELEKAYPKTGEFLSLGVLIWGEKDLFGTLKGYLEALLNKSNVTAKFKPIKDNHLHPAKSAQIEVEGEAIGVIGQIHPHLSASYGVETAVFEFNFEKFVQYARDWKPFTPISQHPEIYEDFSFIIPEKYSLRELMEKVEESSNLIQKVDLIDRYLEKENRSVTLRVVFQSPVKSLSTEEIEPLRKKILILIKKNGGTLRS